MVAESQEYIPGNLKIVETGDGSNTLFHPNLDEHYHSLHGAYRESMHVFIEMGLNAMCEKEHIKILEIGFGTGLNAILTFIHQREGTHIHYSGLELHPLQLDIIKSLRYDSLIDALFQDVFYKLHECDWDMEFDLNDQFTLFKIQDSIHDINFSDQYDLVYFDAFAPRPQPDMWTQDVFEKLYTVMNNNSNLVTYCSKGDVRRAMQSAGFKVDKLPGPPGKREMSRARK